MKTCIYFLVILLSLTLSHVNAKGVAISLGSASDTCPLGRMIIFMDSNNDKVFERVRITECDFLIYTDFDLIIIGYGDILSGYVSDMLEGEAKTMNFRIRIYKRDNSTVAYLYYDKNSSKAVLDYSSSNIPDTDISGNSYIVTSRNGFITLKLDNINVINNNYNYKMDLFDISGKKVDISSDIDFSTNTAIIKVDNVENGFYFLRFYYNNKILFFKIILTN